MKRIYRSGTRYAIGILLMSMSLPATAMERGGTGCEKLAAAIGAEVDSAIWQQISGIQPRRWPGPIVSSGAHTCGTTAAVASSAFSRSFARYGYSIGWIDPGSGDPGDACLSHYLEQCYPDPKRGPIGRMSPTFVNDAWSGVQAAIRPQMPFGIGSDWVTFRGAELEQSLAISLAFEVDGPHERRLPPQKLDGVQRY